MLYYGLTNSFLFYLYIFIMNNYSNNYISNNSVVMSFHWKVDPLVINIMAVCHDSIALDVMHIRSRVARWDFECNACLILNYLFSVSWGITGIWGYFWHILKNLEKLHIFLLNLATFCALFGLSISEFS